MAMHIVDSNLSLSDALAGKEIPEGIKNVLTIVKVAYYSFDTFIHQGQLVVHTAIANEIKFLFKKLLEMRFPIKCAIPIVAYDWNDDVSMAANNTSSFNYRFIHGTGGLSIHSYGLAIDINPALNPYIKNNGEIAPLGASYNPKISGTITPRIAALFKLYGWKWGGDWEPEDWQHFQKSDLYFK